MIYRFFARILGKFSTGFCAPFITPKSSSWDLPLATRTVDIK